jgi:teichoic acid transport system permease protein
MTYINGFYTFILNIVKNKQTLLLLARNDFKAKFASSLFGIVWAFIQPLVTIFVLWFVFEVGFKNPPINNVPFVVWFIPAFLPWSYFSEALISVTNSLIEYKYLVTKVNFRISAIPVVKIISSSFVHIGFILFIFVVCRIYGFSISMYNLQVIYYFICTVILLVGLGWLLSSLAVFIPDILNIVSVFIQIGFWITPIFWSPDNMSQFVQSILKINPMFYICRGYRDSFIDNVWFWERGFTNLYFWGIVIIIFVIGALVFKRLRPHFADVL